MHPCGQKGKAFQQPLDVGVLAFVRFEPKSGGYLRIPVGEICSHPPEKGELALVVVEQIVTHWHHPSRGTRRWRSPAPCRTLPARDWAPCGGAPRLRTGTDGCRSRPIRPERL